MNKYYYKGTLIRTSNHEYKFALIALLRNGNIKCFSCSGTEKGAGKDFNYWRKRLPTDVSLFVTKIEKVVA